MPPTTSQIPATPRQVEFIRSLLASRALTPEQREWVEDRLPGFTKSRASELIERLKALPLNYAAGRTESSEPTTEPEATEPPIPYGIYTVVGHDLEDPQHYVTIRVRDASWANKGIGTVTLEYLTGPDNESDYRGFAFATSAAVQPWRRYREEGSLIRAAHLLVDSDHETRAQYGEAYAMESGRCWRCNRTLTVPESVRRGLGPVCAEALGY